MHWPAGEHYSAWCRQRIDCNSTFCGLCMMEFARRRVRFEEAVDAVEEKQKCRTSHLTVKHCHQCGVGHNRQIQQDRMAEVSHTAIRACIIVLMCFTYVHMFVKMTLQVWSMGIQPLLGCWVCNHLWLGRSALKQGFQLESDNGAATRGGDECYYLFCVGI